MSDFDKEAEREKLRKKYADDEDKRANTKRMSELLLKGATMTNQHCDTCGDPLFRHNGQTFCPTCQADSQQAAAQSDGTQQPTDQAGDADQPQPANAESTPEQPANNTSQPNQSTPTQPATNGQPTQADNQPTNTSQSPATQSSQPTATQPSQSTPQPSQSTPQPSSPATASGNGLVDARQSLAATVTRFSRRAAETDDPRRAKELLSAAREAAETLRALEFN
ncbi:Sjogren's syndrome/scleroderma autoantigen 1 family protein [Halonotius sp. GCM10025705]|uniref:Sjogren's syndrome/scleroderma autoantigen 1 family protein n=1 Tax=Halonotius sp. GCM10025705 TaxID=3252678 RepID=UPI003614DE9E